MARSDMFFKATGQRTGDITGESNDRRFTNQIEVVDWSWGMTAPTAVGGQRTARVLLGELKLVKRVDRASTSLMSVLQANEFLTTAELAVRKAGGASPLPYLVVKLAQARLIGYELRSDIDDHGAPVLTEHWSMTFKTITIDYTQQSDTGGQLGASSFTGESGPA